MYKLCRINFDRREKSYATLKQTGDYKKGSPPEGGLPFLSPSALPTWER